MKYPILMIDRPPQNSLYSTHPRLTDMPRPDRSDRLVINEAPAPSAPYGRDIHGMLFPEDPPEDPRARDELNAALAHIAQNAGATPGRAYFSAPEKGPLPVSRITGPRK